MFESLFNFRQFGSTDSNHKSGEEGTVRIREKKTLIMIPLKQIHKFRQGLQNEVLFQGHNLRCLS